jgi:hypothetical protein
MFNDAVSGALHVIGGSAAANTFWGSSDSSGFYSPRTATLDAKGSTGLYGGHHATGPGAWDGPMVSHVGKYPIAYALGYAIVDGIRFTGFSYKAIRIGGVASGDGPVVTGPFIIQNCEFANGGYNSGDYTDNMSAIWLDGCQACTVTNNWLHNTSGHTVNNGDHLNAIIAWQCENTEITYNTCVSAGNIYGKVVGNQGNEIAFNYVDISNETSGGYGFEDWMGSQSSQNTSLSLTTKFHHNILVMYGNSVAIGQSTLSNSLAWGSPVQIYNNTIVATNSGPVVAWVTDIDPASVQYYNNIYVNNGSGGSWNNFGNFYVNPAAIAVWDYNLVPSSGVTWNLYQNGGFSSVLANLTSLVSVAAGVASKGGPSGMEAHSIAASPTFTKSGTYALAYQLASSSPGIGAGRTNGLASGGACDMGAWGNGAVSIGCNFASGSAVPDPPALSID